MKKCIFNCKIVKVDGVLENHAIFIEGDRIHKIVQFQKDAPSCELDNEVEYFDAKGAYVTSGFIDIHSDNIELAVQPRANSIMNIEIAMREHEKQLVNQGITTMFHSLSVLNQKNNGMKAKEIRKPKNMRSLAELICNFHKRSHLIRHRFHCRYDITNIDGFPMLIELLENDNVHMLSFMDHTPGQGQYRNIEKFRDIMGKREELTNDKFDELIQRRQANEKLTSQMLEYAASIARNKGIPIASHDDDSIEKLNYVQNILGAKISEFPVDIEVARSAKERGMYTLVGAPNVLMGYSHSGNLSATEAILDGCVDILCSDYYPPSLLHAVFKLNIEHKIPLQDAFRLVTINPAQAVGIDEDYGSIEEGKKADLLFINILDETPVINYVFINGELVSKLSYRVG